MNSVRQASRLQINPFRLGSEHVDGAWWPRSRCLVDELPDLLTWVSPRLGRVVLIGYSRTGWDEAPASVEIDSHTIELLSFTNDQPASLIAIGEDGRHLTLHVIAPSADEQTARRAFGEFQPRAEDAVPPTTPAAVARSLDDVAEKLIQHEGLNDAQRATQIQRWCEEAAQQFVDAPVQTFVPILVEHIVHDRMIRSRRAAVDQGRNDTGLLGYAPLTLLNRAARRWIRCVLPRVRRDAGNR